MQCGVERRCAEDVSKGWSESCMTGLKVSEQKLLANALTRYIYMSAYRRVRVAWMNRSATALSICALLGIIAYYRAPVRVCSILWSICESVEYVDKQYMKPLSVHI